MVDLATPQALAQIQRYVANMEQARGFSQRSVIDQCLLLGEEVGELFKAVRKRVNMPTDPHSQIGNVDDELADVLIFLCAIANRFDIDLETALRNKEQANELRTWR